MKTVTRTKPDRSSTFVAQTAKDVMMINPLCINQNAKAQDAATFLTAKGISAAPVIDEAGRPVGVLSRADLVRHARANGPPGFQHGDATVNEIMTPVVYFVRPQASVLTVIDDLLDCMVHRLFVVDDHGVLIGVISALDILRSLRADKTAASSSACQIGRMNRAI